MEARITSLPEEIVRLVAIALCHSHGPNSLAYPANPADYGSFSCPPKDLLNFALSCKYLFDIIYPVLWRTVAIKQSDDLPPLPDDLAYFANNIRPSHPSPADDTSLTHPPSYLDRASAPQDSQDSQAPCGCNCHQARPNGYSHQPEGSVQPQGAINSHVLDSAATDSVSNYYYFPISSSSHQQASSSIQPYVTSDPQTQLQSTSITTPWFAQNHLHGDNTTDSHTIRRGLNTTSNSHAQYPPDSTDPSSYQFLESFYSTPTDGLHNASPKPYCPCTERHQHTTEVSHDPRPELVKSRWADRWQYAPKNSNLTSSPTDSYSRSIPHGHMDLTTPLEDGFNTVAPRRRSRINKQSSRGGRGPKNSPVQDNSDMIPQYVVNGDKFISSYLNGTASQLSLESIRKIKIPLDGTAGSIFPKDMNLSNAAGKGFRSDGKRLPKPLANLQIVEVCDEPGIQSPSASKQGGDVFNIPGRPGEGVAAFEIQEASNSHSLAGTTNTRPSSEDGYASEQRRAAQFVGFATTEYTDIQLSSTIVSTLMQFECENLLSRLCVLDIAVQFYEVPGFVANEDEIEGNNDNNTQPGTPVEIPTIRASSEGIWFLEVALKQMYNLESLALTDRIVSPPNRPNANGGFNGEDADSQYIPPERASPGLASFIVPLWQSLIVPTVTGSSCAQETFSAGTSASPLSNLKELTLPNCFCQFITPDLIPPSVEVLTLNTFFPSLFTSRAHSQPTTALSGIIGSSGSQSAHSPENAMVPSGSRSVSKLALNVGPDGLKLAFPQGVAPGSSGSAASAIQVIPATPSPSPQDAGPLSPVPVSIPSARFGSIDTRPISIGNESQVGNKAWTSDLTALQIWMPTWYQNSNNNNGFDRNGNPNNNDDEPNILPPSPLIPNNPLLSAAANAARNIPRGRTSLGDNFLQQVTMPLLSPRMKYLVLSSLPITLLEVLPDLCPKLEVLLIENWDYCSQTPVSGIINNSNYHVYYTDDTPPQGACENETDYFGDTSYFENGYSDDEYDDYDEDEEIHTMTVEEVNRQLDSFLGAATTSGFPDLADSYEVYRVLRDSFRDRQPAESFTVTSNGYNGLLECFNALEHIKSMLADDPDDAAGDVVEPGYAIGVTHDDLASAAALSDTAVAMFQNTVRLCYAPESDSSASSVEIGGNRIQVSSNTPVSLAASNSINESEIPDQPSSSSQYNYDSDAFNPKKRNSDNMQEAEFPSAAGGEADDNNENGDHITKKRRYSIRKRSGSGKSVDLSTLFPPNMGSVWSSDDLIAKYVTQLSTLNPGGALGSVLSKNNKGKVAPSKKESFRNWLDNRFSTPPPYDRSCSSGTSSSSRSRAISANRQQGSSSSGNDSADNGVASALASSASNASREAYESIQLQNEQDQQALVQLNHSLVHLAKKCGKTLQFVYLPIDPNTIHAATLSFMLCYCMIAQRNKQYDAAEDVAPSAFDLDEESIGSPQRRAGTDPKHGNGLKLYVKYQIRQPAKLLYTGMGLTEEDLVVDNSESGPSLSSSSMSRPSRSRLHNLYRTHSRTNSGSTLGVSVSEGLGGNCVDDNGADQTDQSQVIDPSQRYPAFPMTQEELRATVKRGTGMSSELFEEMAVSLGEACAPRYYPPGASGAYYAEAPDIGGDERFLYTYSSLSADNSFKVGQGETCSSFAPTQETLEMSPDPFAMAKLLVASYPHLTPLESCSASNAFAACPPSEIIFGHRRHQSANSSVVFNLDNVSSGREDSTSRGGLAHSRTQSYHDFNMQQFQSSNPSELKRGESGAGPLSSSISANSQQQQQNQQQQENQHHESYPLFKVYEYLVNTHSPALNNCIYRVSI